MKKIIIGVMLGLLISCVISCFNRKNSVEIETAYEFGWIDGCDYAVRSYETITKESWKEQLKIDYAEFVKDISK